MKKVIQTRILALFMMALIPLLSPAVNTIIYNATYDFDNLTLGTDTLGGVTYTTVNYDGLFNGGEPGKPSLPIDYIKFSVPYNATNFTVTATLQNNLFSNISHLVCPCQPARLMNDTTPIVIAAPDNNVYNAGSYYPSQNAWVVDEGFLAGENHIVTVAVMPLSYMHRVMGNITTNQLRKTGTICITLSYNLSDTLSMYPIVRADVASRVEGHQLAQRIVVNPNQVLVNAPTQSFINQYNNALNNLMNSGVDNTRFPYLIITSPEFKHALRRLVALKKQLGEKVKVVTVDEVVNDPNVQCGDIVSAFDVSLDGDTTFNDSIGKIRQYIRNSFIFNGTYTVLLVGNIVPYRMIDISCNYNSKDTIITIPSDHYYADLNGDWRYNEIDSHCEIDVGRVIAHNEQQVINFIDKVLRYQLNPGNGDLDYVNRILFTSPKELSDYYDPNDEEIYHAKKYMLEFFRDSCDIWENGNYPSGEDVVNIINQTQFGFLNFMNYAFPRGIITSSTETNNIHKNYLWAIDSINTTDYGYLQQFGLNNLNNKSYPSICYTLGPTMPFDLNSQYDYMNFGESFITGKDYGGPAFIGYTRDIPLSESFDTERRFGRGLVNAYYYVGDALSYSKIYADDYTCVSYNLLGDPDLIIWNNSYHTPIGPDPNIMITRSDNSITITPTDNEAKYIWYCSNEGVIGRSYCSRYPTTLKNVSPNSTIIVKNTFNVPYIAPLEIQNTTIANSQYVIASDVNIGRSIDSNRTIGDVIVPNDIGYEIEASGTVTLNNGFIVEKGGIFAVYPSCY